MPLLLSGGCDWPRRASAYTAEGRQEIRRPSPRPSLATEAVRILIGGRKYSPLARRRLPSSFFGTAICQGPGGHLARRKQMSPEGTSRTSWPPNLNLPRSQGPCAENRDGPCCWLHVPALCSTDHRMELEPSQPEAKVAEPAKPGEVDKRPPIGQAGSKRPRVPIQLQVRANLTVRLISKVKVPRIVRANLTSR